MTEYTSESDAISAAQARSRVIGWAYAIYWPAGQYWTVEDRKPSLCSRGTIVREVDESGRVRLA